MKKTVSICLMATLAVYLWAPLARSETRNFQVSVIIPHIPGVNSPLASDTRRMTATATSRKEAPSAERVNLSGSEHIDESPNGQQILVKTFTEM